MFFMVLIGFMGPGPWKSDGGPKKKSGLFSAPDLGSGDFLKKSYFWIYFDLFLMYFDAGLGLGTPRMAPVIPGI